MKKDFLVKEEDEGFGLQALVLGPVEGHEGDALHGAVVVEGDGFGNATSLRQNAAGIEFDPASVYQNLLNH